MSEGPYLAPYFCSDALADDEVQAMARRQFGVSLVVGLALVIAAVALGGVASQTSRADIAPQHRVTHPDAARVDIGQPMFGTKVRG
jgi:hypothetical protein